MQNHNQQNYRLFVHSEKCDEVFDFCRSVDEEVWLCWSTMTATATNFDETTFPLGVLWDAERSHEWLTQELIPQVIKWRDYKSPKKSKLRLRNLFIKENEEPTDYTAYYSSSNTIEQISLKTISSFSELLETVEILQSFYTVRRTSFISPQTMIEVYKHLNWCFRNFHLNSYSTDYIAGNLGKRVSEDTLIKTINDKIEICLNSNECYASELEMALRTLIEFYKKGLPQPAKYKIMIEAKNALTTVENDFNHKSFFYSLYSEI